jgi:hypothetical protein
MRDLGVDGNIILEWMLKMYIVRVWFQVSRGKGKWWDHVNTLMKVLVLLKVN